MDFKINDAAFGGDGISKVKDWSMSPTLENGYANASDEYLSTLGLEGTDRIKYKILAQQYNDGLGPDYLGGIKSAFDIAGGLGQISSFLDDRKLRKKQIEALDANIGNLQFAQNDRTNMLNTVNSVFA
jgi:hypothetical protein